MSVRATIFPGTRRRQSPTVDADEPPREQTTLFPVELERHCPR